MEEQFNQFGLSIIGALKKNNVLLVKETPISDDGKKYCLKLNAAEQEIKLFKDYFPKIDQSKFKRLQLPVAYKTGSLFENERWWILTDYYGKPIDWDETNPESVGGRNIGLDYVDILADILADLKLIDTSLFSGILPSVESVPWYTRINQKLTDLIKNNLFPSSYQKKAITMLTSGFTSESRGDFILTNGDFQFRNFIKLPNHKIVVIDWTENPFNTPNIEPIEFAAMYQWTLMWANSPWQDAYIKKISKKFNISKDRLKFALLVKSINQAHMWRGNHELSRLQVNNSIRALDGLI